VIQIWAAKREPGPFLYAGAGAKAPRAVQEAIQEYRALPEDERVETPLLYWLLGDGTPPFKMTKVEAGYIDDSPYNQNCGNCTHAYTHVTSGIAICDQMRGVIEPQAWCRVWSEPDDPEEYREYQERS